MRTAYPTIFYNDEDAIGVVVPDIKNCFTCGDDMADAIEMAKDCAEMLLVSFEDDDQELPKPSTISQIIEKVKSGKIEDIPEDFEVSYVAVDTNEWRKNFNGKSIRKNVTIPEWLNKKAEKANVNFSQILQNALMQYLDIA